MCATCFDLSVSLLRVLEMTVTLVPEIFLDWSRPSAELLLRRLAQVRRCRVYSYAVIQSELVIGRFQTR